MKNIALSLIVFILSTSCKSTSSAGDEAFKSVTIDTVLNDKISVRALLFDKDKIWYSGDKSRLGYYDFKTLTHVQKTISNTNNKLEFRSIAQNSKSIFIANIGNPATIFKVNKTDLSFQKVYTENNAKVFYDSMIFWNNKEGIAIGDPTEDCLSVLITRDSGKTWKNMEAYSGKRSFWLCFMHSVCAQIKSETTRCGRNFWIVLLC